MYHPSEYQHIFILSVSKGYPNFDEEEEEPMVRKSARIKTRQSDEKCGGEAMELSGRDEAEDNEEMQTFPSKKRPPTKNAHATKTDSKSVTETKTTDSILELLTKIYQILAL